MAASAHGSYSVRMRQELPGPLTTDTLAVPLPDVVERWRDLYAQDLGQKIILFVGFALFLYFLARLGRRLVSEQVEDVNRRHAIRKAIGYVLITLLLLFGVALFADSLGGFGTVLGLVLAGVAVALQDVLKSVVGWLYLSARSGVEVGSRIEVAGVTGDVIDIGVLKTTVLEVGNLVFGRQSTGRLVTIPNYHMLSANVVVSGLANPFVWQEVRVTVPFDSDWERAEELLREVGDELHAEIEPELEAGFRRLEKRYAFEYGTLTPIVYVTLGAYGVELTLRFLTHVRRRRGSEDRVGRRLLAAFAAEPNVHFAYPTNRVLRHGERGIGLYGDPFGPLSEEGAPPGQ
jgi:small-conductance mechanosensitive channel